MAELPTRLASDRIDYFDLYSRWEGGNWRATELDFEQDKIDWRERYDDFERTAALWNYALFFWGEDAVADGLAPYIDAAPREEQKYFLATQQVDEARHAVFFKRFMHEVCGIGEGDVASGLKAIQPELTWGFTKVFDRLDDMAAELRRKPTLPNLAAGVALYHVIIEATLAQPGQHFITSYLEERRIMPGFLEGMHNVAADEQRHIGFGVKLLADIAREDPDCKHAVADLLREVIPWTISVLAPPNWDRRYTEVFGATLEDIGEEGVASLETKMRSAGLPLEELPGPPVFPMPGLSPRERAVRGQRLARTGFIGEKVGPPSRDPEDVQIFFDSVAGAFDTSRAPSAPATIEWDFEDFEPWHVVVANGDTRAARGPAPEATVKFRCRFEDWVDVTAGRQDAAKLALRRGLRPSGDLRWLWRARRMFPS